MINIFTWAVSSIFYSAGYTYWYTRRTDYSEAAGIKLGRNFVIIALLCLPININGNVFTVMGAVASSRNTYAIMSPFQVADHNAYTFVGLPAVFQKAGNNTYVTFGLVGIQKAGNDAGDLLTLNLYQNAGQDAGVVVGLSAYQKAGRDAVHGIAMVGYQTSGRAAVVFAGVTGYQSGNNNNNKEYSANDAPAVGTGIGISLYQSGHTTGCVVGLVAYQTATKSAESAICLALIQRAGNLDRAFAVFSKLQVPDKNTKK